MSFELGIIVGMSIVCAIFAYFSANENNVLFKWFYLILSFSFMTGTINIMKRIVVLEGLPTAISDGFVALENVMMTIVVLLIALFFLMMLKNVFEMYMPKKKSFKDMNPLEG